MGLIQSWADAFQGQPDLAGVVQVYQDLKSKGIEFPMTDLDAMAPILTPKRVTFIYMRELMNLLERASVFPMLMGS